MDPLSITASVAGIAATCLRIAKTLSDLRDRYKDADLTMASIYSETTIIGTTLAKIQMILLNKQYILTPELHATPGGPSVAICPAHTRLLYSTWHTAFIYRPEPPISHAKTPLRAEPAALPS
jgi:hypothetical protein